MHTDSCLMPPFGLIRVTFFCSYKQFGVFSGSEVGLGEPYFVADILAFYWLPSGPQGYSPCVVNYITDVLIPELFHYLL